MNRQTSTDVIINGKQYTLSGYESSEYMHRVAAYLNEKYDELKKQPFFRQLDGDMRNVLLQLNVADDYFKLKEQMRHTESDRDVKSNEVFDLRHEILSLQTKLEAAQKELEQAKEARHEEEKKNIRLETELKNLQRLVGSGVLPEHKNGEKPKP